MGNKQSQNSCATLELFVHGSRMMASACRPGPLCVRATLESTQQMTRGQSNDATSPSWNELLQMGCHPPTKPLLVEVVNCGDGPATVCSSFTLDNWLGMSNVYDPSEAGRGNTPGEYNKLWAGKLEIAVSLSSFYERPENSNSFENRVATQHRVVTALTIIFPVLFILIACVCKRRGAIRFQSSLPPARPLYTLPGASHHPPASMQEYPASAAWPQQPTQPYARPAAEAPAWGADAPPAEAAAAAAVEVVPVAEAVAGYGTSYRGGFAEMEMVGTTDAAPARRKG